MFASTTPAQRWLAFIVLLVVAIACFFPLARYFNYALYNVGGALLLMGVLMAALAGALATAGAPVTRPGRFARIALLIIAIPLVLCGLLSLVDGGGHPPATAFLWLLLSLPAPVFVVVALGCLAFANANGERWVFLVAGLALCLVIAVGATALPTFRP
jgi:cytochrome bd-type quinol oxidase subunit 2